MPDIDCPECPESVDSRGAWTHLVQKHGWESERAKAWLQDRKGGPESAEINRDGETTAQNDPNQPENERETPASQSNSDETPDADETSIVVKEEGSEKLSPDGFDSKNRPEMGAPEGSNLPSDTTPDDFEPDESSETTLPTDADPDETTAEADPEADDESGGLMDRLRASRGEPDEKSAEEIVEEADDEETRERRQQVLDALNGEVEDEEDDESGESGRESSDSSASVGGSTEVQGALVNEAMLASVCTMPFHSAAKATGWEGWELDDREREKLQELIIQWADEKNVELDANVLLAMSLSNIVGSRAIGYARYRRGESDSSETRADSGDNDGISGETGTDEGEESDSDEFDFEEPNFGG